MKKNLSHNPSMSSSSTVSFDAKNICSSKNATTAGCLAGILRRILCTRSLPTHPSDHITDHTTSISWESEEKNREEKVVPTPSIVARLMGLESMPNGAISSNPNSITRCRSMNSMDCKGRSYQHTMQGEQGRVNSTLSFREMPIFLELENEEFFVLSFENESETKHKRLRGRKCEMRYGELNQTSGEKSESNESSSKVIEKSNMEDQKTGNEKNLSQRISNKPGQEIGISAKTCVSDGAKLRRKKKKKVESFVEHDCCSSEESSPISVLDFDQFLLDREFPTSELYSDSLESNSRRKLSPEPQNNEFQSPRRRNDNNLIIPDNQKTKKTEGKCFGSGIRDCNHQTYLDICEQICKMTEAEIAEHSNGMCRRNILKDEDFDDIYADFEFQILDQSLGELIHLLIELHM